MTFELALSGHVKHHNSACSGRNEIGEFGSGYTYEASQAICDGEDTLRLFRVQDMHGIDKPRL